MHTHKHACEQPAGAPPAIITKLEMGLFLRRHKSEEESSPLSPRYHQSQVIYVFLHSELRSLWGKLCIKLLSLNTVMLQQLRSGPQNNKCSYLNLSVYLSVPSTDCDIKMNHVGAVWLPVSYALDAARVT